jgi:uncharacterized protein YndB with AHSA1/START domain
MTRVDFSTAVDMRHPPEVAFTYLVEPRNRPEWQASLLSVRLDHRDAEPTVGLTWQETTVVGIKPRMEITELVPYRLFAERGRWGGVEGVLMLRFVATGKGSRVTAEGHVEGSGPWKAAVRAAGLLADRSLKSDLERASRILTDRGPR